MKDQADPALNRVEARSEQDLAKEVEIPIDPSTSTSPGQVHLLNEYIKGDANISLPEDAPRIGHGRVFMSRSVVYVGVKSVDLLTPQEDIHNVVCDLQRWKFYE